MSTFDFSCTSGLEEKWTIPSGILVGNAFISKLQLSFIYHFYLFN